MGGCKWFQMGAKEMLTAILPTPKARESPRPGPGGLFFLPGLPPTPSPTFNGFEPSGVALDKAGSPKSCPIPITAPAFVTSSAPEP